LSERFGMGAPTWWNSKPLDRLVISKGLSLRLYNPTAHQWSLNFANINSGTLSVPTIGEFKNGRGEFYNQEPFNGRAILVRFVISDVTSKLMSF
jgi:hypothetical protein